MAENAPVIIAGTPGFEVSNRRWQLIAPTDVPNKANGANAPKTPGNHIATDPNNSASPTSSMN